MKKKKNIFENKLQELNKLKIESKKEVLAKEQKEKDEEKEFEEYCEAETRKYLKGFDKERSDLKKFIKEVNKKFYKKYEINVINPDGPRSDDTAYCKDTGGYNMSYILNPPNDLKKSFEIDIFSVYVLKKPISNRAHETTAVELKYINEPNPQYLQWSSHFKVCVGDRHFSPANYINADFLLKDHGSKARELAVEDYINKLTDCIKFL